MEPAVWPRPEVAGRQRRSHTYSVRMAGQQFDQHLWRHAVHRLGRLWRRLARQFSADEQFVRETKKDWQYVRLLVRSVGFWGNVRPQQPGILPCRLSR